MASAEELKAAVVSALKAAGDGEVTAREIRAACERQLKLPQDGLLSRKDEIMAMISQVLSKQQQQPEPQCDPVAIQACVSALEDADGGRARADALVMELSTGEDGKAAAEALVLLAEACAASETAASQLLDAQIARVLAGFIDPKASSKVLASLAVRLLSALSTHAKLTDGIVRSAALAPVLARLAMSIDGVGVQCAALLHNLADSPATRMRLLHAGLLGVLTRLIVEPSVSAGLKEHCLQAAASLAGMPESELSFPQLLGHFVAHKMPGTQRQALSALTVIREAQPGVEGRLAQVSELTKGLEVATASSDAAVASEAQQLLDALRR